MSNPQQPELRRSEYTAATQDSWVNSVGGATEAEEDLTNVPEASQPGHHPEHDQDKPDLDRFAEAFGVTPAAAAAADDAAAAADDQA